MTDATTVSVIIPTYNGSNRIVNCLDALSRQKTARKLEILVVDDGSADNTAEVVSRYEAVRLIRQANAGPAAARNRGAAEASGSIILFTDDDCVPTENWIDAMLAPFEDPQVVGAKGVYRTRQKSLIARFVQIEYEDKYRLMRNASSIDFVDTYSAAFRRDRFLELDGYDTAFPVACAEDIELSYRMSARGWKMVFVQDAVVYHTHPDTLSCYLNKKYKFAFWRMLAIRKHPDKSVKDSHTPQIMKLQILFAPALIVALVVDFLIRPAIRLSGLTVVGFLITTAPFDARALARDPAIGLMSPFLLACRACAQLLGVARGTIHALRAPIAVSSNSRS